MAEEQSNNMTSNECPVCSQKEVEQLRRDLSECKKRGQTKDKQIKHLNKRVFILTMIAIAIGAIFGKEALDSITEWLGSIKGFRGAVDGQAMILPEPGTLAVFGLLLVKRKSRRRR